MSTYRVKPGYTFGGATLLPAGSLVELTEAEASGFLDKLELVEGGEERQGAPHEPKTTPTPATVRVREPLTVSVPQETAPTPQPEQAISKDDVKEAVKGAESADGGSERGSGGGKRKV